MSPWFSGSAVVRQLVAEWRLDAAGAAWLTIAVQLGFVAGALVSALTNLSDLLPARRIFFVSALGAALANALFAAAHGGGAGIALRFATGFFLAGIYPTALKVMATWFREDRGLSLGIMVGALTIGSAMPHLVNGLGGVTWRTGVLVTSALTAIGGIVTLTLVADGPYPFPRAVFDPGETARILRNRGVRLACLGYFGHMWELYAMWAWFLVFFADSGARWASSTVGGAPGAGHSAVTPAAASFATFAVIAIGAVGCWLGGVLGDRWGRTRITTLSMAISGVCSLAAGFVFGAAPPLVLALGLVWGVSVVADSAQFSTMVTELADQAYVGTALTLQLGIGFTLTVATIWLVPLLRDAIGWRWAFAFLVPGPVLGIVSMLRLQALPEARRIAGGRG